MTIHIDKNLHTRLSALDAWRRWRAICDRIVAHPQYVYGSKCSQTLAKLARFAMLQMTIYNERVHRPHSIARMCPTLWANYQAACERERNAGLRIVARFPHYDVTVWEVKDENDEVLVAFDSRGGYTRADAEKFVDESICSDIDAVLGGAL